MAVRKSEAVMKLSNLGRPIAALVAAAVVVSIGFAMDPLPAATQPIAATAPKLKVGINLTTIETLPIYLAADDTVELTGGALPALIDHKVDAATNAETQAILRSTTSPDIRVVMTVAEYSYHIVARRSAGIQTAADLRGKKIATALSSSAHFYVAKMLQSAGLSESDVTIVGLPPPEMAAALARHDVDAVSIWEPLSAQSAEALGTDVVILQGPAYGERFDLNTTTAVTADPVKRTQLVALLRAIIHASQQVRDHPEHAQPLIADKLKLPPALIAATWNLFRFPAGIGDDLLPTMVEQELWMAKIQNRPPRPDTAIAGLIDKSLWQEAKSP
jgi:sulfonate transport system substrate-binding protein